MPAHEAVLMRKTLSQIMVEPETDDSGKCVSKSVVAGLVRSFLTEFRAARGFTSCCRMSGSGCKYSMLKDRIADTMLFSMHLMDSA
eukprot:766225-Hanusia_phi.AAC.2